MAPPLITALYAGLNALILLWLTATVVRGRFAKRVSIGDGGDETLMRLIRGHANAAETMPMALILLGLAEAIGAPASALHVLGIAFTAGRFLHALHFAGLGSQFLRMVGMIATLIVILALAIGLVAHSIVRLF